MSNSNIYAKTLINSRSDEKIRDVKHLVRVPLYYIEHSMKLQTIHILIGVGFIMQ